MDILSNFTSSFDTSIRSISNPEAFSINFLAPWRPPLPHLTSPKARGVLFLPFVIMNLIQKMKTFHLTQEKPRAIIPLSIFTILLAPESLNKRGQIYQTVSGSYQFFRSRMLETGNYHPLKRILGDLHRRLEVHIARAKKYHIYGGRVREVDEVHCYLYVNALLPVGSSLGGFTSYDPLMDLSLYYSNVVAVMVSGTGRWPNLI